MPKPLPALAAPAQLTIVLEIGKAEVMHDAVLTGQEGVVRGGLQIRAICTSVFRLLVHTPRQPVQASEQVINPLVKLSLILQVVKIEVQFISHCSKNMNGGEKIA